MAAPPYQKWFWGSYHKHTSHLRDARDHGAYMLLIGALWNNGGRLPADDEALAGYAMLSPKDWASVKPKLLRPGLLRIVRGKLTQDRVTEDLAKYRATSGKRKEAGKAGGMASAGKHGGNRQAIATILPTKPEPEPKKKPPKPPEGAFDLIGKDFEKAWAAYPDTTTTSRDQALAAFEAELPRAGGCAPLARAVEAFAAHQAQAGAGAKRPPAFHVWLARRRYDTFLSASGPPASHRWTGPQNVWDLVALARSPEFANSWLGASTWQADPPTVISPALAFRRLRDEVGSALADKGIRLTERAA